MTVSEFDTVTAGIAYVPKGMWPSELYLFSEVCQKSGVNWIIESGVRNGFSTRMLRALWPGCVQSVELKPTLSPIDLRETLIGGDAMTVVPRLVAERPTARIGVLLDGPKKARGVALRNRVRMLDPVVVVAQHDTAKGQSETLHSWDVRDKDRAALDGRIGHGANKFPNGPGLALWVRA